MTRPRRERNSRNHSAPGDREGASHETTGRVGKQADRGAYRSILTVLGKGPDFRKLNRHAKALLPYLKLECGFYGLLVRSRLGLIYDFVDQMGMAVEEVEAGLDDLEATGWIEREENILWIVDGLKFEPGFYIWSPNHRAGLRSFLDGLPHMPIIDRFKERYKDQISTDQPHFPKVKVTLPESVHDTPAEVKVTLSESVHDTFPKVSEAQKKEEGRQKTEVTAKEKLDDGLAAISSDEGHVVIGQPEDGPKVRARVKEPKPLSMHPAAIASRAKRARALAKPAGGLPAESGDRTSVPEIQPAVDAVEVAECLPVEALLGAVPDVALAKPKKPKETWLTVYLETAKEVEPGFHPSEGVLAKVCAALEKEYGRPEVIRRWRNFCLRHAGPELTYVSVPNFQVKWGVYEFPVAPPSRVRTRKGTDQGGDAVVARYNGSLLAPVILGPEDDNLPEDM